MKVRAIVYSGPPTFSYLCLHPTRKGVLLWFRFPTTPTWKVCAIPLKAPLEPNTEAALALLNAGLYSDIVDVEFEEESLAVEE